MWRRPTSIKRRDLVAMLCYKLIFAIAGTQRIAKWPMRRDNTRISKQSETQHLAKPREIVFYEEAYWRNVDRERNSISSDKILVERLRALSTFKMRKCLRSRNPIVETGERAWRRNAASAVAERLAGSLRHLKLKCCSASNNSFAQVTLNICGGLKKFRR